MNVNKPSAAGRCSPSLGDMLEAERSAVKWEAYHNSLNILEREMTMSESALARLALVKPA